jgi:hypothetical protein
VCSLAKAGEPLGLSAVLARETAVLARGTTQFVLADVALTVGFAGVTFVRLAGLVAPGRVQPAGPSGDACRRDYGWAGQAAVAVLAAVTALA